MLYWMKPLPEADIDYEKYKPFISNNWFRQNFMQIEVAELINLPFEEKTVILYKKKKQALSINSNIR